MHIASFWSQEDSDNNDVRCRLCPHLCRITSGGWGRCRTRYNEDARLYAMNYGRVTSLALDDIEKKPLRMYKPGTKVLSIGTFGCNFACGFCQNWTIAQGDRSVVTRYVSAEEAVKKALELVEYGNIGLAYTYSEPSVWYEYVFDTAKRAKEAGLKNILVTNGYLNPDPLKKLLPYIDAVNLDIKAFTSDFYRKVCGGSLEPVLKAARLFAKECHLEITNLIIPSMNDSSEEISTLSEWIASIDKSIPLHLTRYFPQYKFTLPSTSPETLVRAKKVAEKSLKYVFLGNI